MNREAQQQSAETAHNIAELAALDAAIETERERISSPPTSREDARERMREAEAPFDDAIRTRGAVARTARDIERDGRSWWMRAAMRITEKARNLVAAVVEKARDYWQGREQDRNQERGRDEGGLER